MTNFEWPKNLQLGTPDCLKLFRQIILEQIYIPNSGHPGGSLSMVEILSAIFNKSFHHDPKNQTMPERDRFVLSKGHGCPALYTTMSFLGYFPGKELENFRKFSHFLQGHPDRDKYPLMEASTGSLGQGLSVALGLALALRLDYQSKKISRLPKVYCVVGDGEMQEGQIWEALMAAAKFQLGNLVCVVDYNGGQIDGPVKEVMNLEPIDEKLKSFGWEVNTLDGHSFSNLDEYFQSRTIQATGKPHFLVAKTLKGKGVSFMEHPTKWHGAAPKREELEKAIDELWSTQKAPYGRLVNS